MSETPVQLLAQTSKSIRHSTLVVELLARLCLQLHPTERRLGVVVWASRLLFRVSDEADRARRAERFLTTVTLVIPNTQVGSGLGAGVQNRRNSADMDIADARNIDTHHLDFGFGMWIHD